MGWQSMEEKKINMQQAWGLIGHKLWRPEKHLVETVNLVSATPIDSKLHQILMLLENCFIREFWWPMDGGQ